MSVKKGSARPDHPPGAASCESLNAPLVPVRVKMKDGAQKMGEENLISLTDQFLTSLKPTKRVWLSSVESREDSCGVTVVTRICYAIGQSTVAPTIAENVALNQGA